MKNVKDAARQMIKILRDVLTVTSLDTLKIDEFFFDPCLVCKCTLENFVDSIHKHYKLLRVVFTATHNVPKLAWGDGKQFAHALSIMLSNAIKFSEKSGGLIKITLGVHKNDAFLLPRKYLTNESIRNSQVVIFDSLQRNESVTVNESEESVINIANALKAANTLREYSARDIHMGAVSETTIFIDPGSYQKVPPVRLVMKVQDNGSSPTLVPL
jgi:signal transduction histidine kinase